MIICGIDYSINSPAVVKANLDNNLDIYKLSYIGFSSVKKTANLDSNIIHYNNKKQFQNNYEKYIWVRDNIFTYIASPDYVAMEGYAFATKGLVFNIAEATMCTKLAIYENSIPIRIYDPNSIKLYATGMGNSKKLEMEVAYENFSELKPNWSHLPASKNPKEDLIDAFFTLKLLQLELKLRHGIVQLKDLSLEHIKIFNRVTKANPTNILATDFIWNA